MNFHAKEDREWNHSLQSFISATLADVNDRPALDVEVEITDIECLARHGMRPTLNERVPMAGPVFDGSRKKMPAHDGLREDGDATPNSVRSAGVSDATSWRSRPC